MIPAHRTAYNASFNANAYQAFLQQIETDFPGQLDFRVAETPVFVPRALKEQIIQAGEEIIDTLVDPTYKTRTERAIPPTLRTPNEDDHPDFLILDYAVCKDANGNLTPQLIELQGFPSLFAYQAYLNTLYPKFFYHPEGFSPYFGGLNETIYLEKLRNVLLGNGHPEHTILMEIFPEKQKTRVDFAATKKFLGIEPVCLTQVRRSGKTLYYEKDGKKVEIQRIYNRVIFDELNALPNLKTEFHLTDDVDVTWVAHPNWFFRISKFSLPLLQSRFVPKSYFLHELEHYPEELEQYVLKPLFSFAGQGVQLHITQADLDAIPDKENYLLQHRVHYEPALHAPNGDVKIELRMMYVWPKNQARPELIGNLARLSRGEMIGVRYNSQFDWVGGTTAYFELD